MEREKPDISALPENLVMNLSSDAYVRVLWAFAIALAKTSKPDPALHRELIAQLDSLAESVPEDPDNGVRVWQTLIEAHANGLLEALGYQGEAQK